MRLRLAIVSTVPLPPALAAVALAGQVVFIDGDFDDAVWTAEEIFDGSPSGAGAFDAARSPDGGNPGGYRRVTLHFTSGDLVVAHFHDDWVYEPSSQGPIETLDYSYDLTRESTPQNVRYRIVLEQDGVYYSGLPADAAQVPFWERSAHNGLTPKSFAADLLARHPGSGGSQPDFSLSGTPIRIGYRSSNCCDGQTTSGVDNFVVTLNTTPAACDVSPSVLDFGTVAVGTSSSASFVVRNVGSEPFDGEVAEACDGFTVVSGAGPYSLMPGDSLTAVVEFAPETDGEHACVIETGCVAVPCTGDAPPFSDLVAGEITCVVVGSDSVRVVGEFRNAGSRAVAETFRVRMEVTGCAPLWSDTQVVPGLDAGASGVIELGSIPIDVYPCTVSLRVDLDDVVFEPNEVNNDVNDAITCVLPSIEPVAITCRPYSATADSVRIRGVFENSGLAESAGFFVRMEITECVGLVGETQFFDSLQPGARDTLDVVVPVSEVRCSATLTVDTNDDVTESDEADNHLAVQIACGTVEVPPTGEIASTLSVLPNPSEGSVAVRLGGAWGEATITVFDVAGRAVRRLRPPGAAGTASWDATDDAGRRVAPGHYFLRATNDTGRVSAVRLLLLR